MKLRASQVAAAVGGQLLGADVEVDGASFDSRALRVGELFVPIVAARDGHEFIEAAFSAGASAVLASRPIVPPSRRGVVQVADTAAALMTLAAWARDRFAGRVVGITGSVGKTSTKDLTHAALSAGLTAVVNERSFNNEQGLPVTILCAPDSADALVLEMGMRRLGDISRLCGVARPDIGVVTAVGEAHTELVGGIAGVSRAKGELVEALPSAGTAVLNTDDERVRALRERTTADVVTFGLARNADVRIADLTLDDRARPRFRIETPWGSADVRLAISGAHMATNAAAALAVAGLLGVDLDAASAALADAELSPMRMQLRAAPAGGTVIDDSYNANPTSMRAALDALTGMSARRRVAVLGTMAEIDDPDAGHRAIAAHAAALDIELVAVETQRYGVPAVDVLSAASAVGPVTAGTVVLVKASRGAGLERVVTALLAP